MNAYARISLSGYLNFFSIADKTPWPKQSIEERAYLGLKVLEGCSQWPSWQRTRQQAGRQAWHWSSSWELTSWDTTTRLRSLTGNSMDGLLKFQSSLISNETTLPTSCLPILPTQFHKLEINSSVHETMENRDFQRLWDFKNLKYFRCDININIWSWKWTRKERLNNDVFVYHIEKLLLYSTVLYCTVLYWLIFM